MPLFGPPGDDFKLSRGKAQKPLTREEMAPLIAWERRISQLYVAAGALILAGVLGHRLLGFSSDSYKTAVVVVTLGLLTLAAIVQRQVRCPRCEAYLGQNFRASLPEYCRGCGASIQKDATPQPPGKDASKS